jgi:RNA polymerase sigma factor (sigma-70 family)
MPHRLAHHSDGDLLRLVRDGRTEAADQLWRRHYPAVLATARRSAPRGHDPEDLASEAFTAMLRALRSGAGPTEAIRAYLNTAVRRAAGAAAHRREIPLDRAEALETLAPPVPGPDARVPRHTMIRETFAALPPRWQTVLARSIVHGDSNADIAQAMGLTPNAVAALATRARQGWRRRYLQEYAALHAPTRRDCADLAPQLIEMFAAAVPRKAPQVVTGHLHHCPECTARVDALRRAHRELAGTVHPALLALHGDDPGGTPPLATPQR